MGRFVFLFFVISAFLAARPAFAAGERDFTATAFQYDTGLQNPMVSKRFDCRIKTFEQGSVRKTTISSFVSGKPTPDVTIDIISSNNSVANIIYNSKMEPVAQYPRGEALGPNLFLFKGGDEKRKEEGRWYMDQDYLMSDFSIADAKGAIIYKETVIYQAKKPLRK